MILLGALDEAALFVSRAVDAEAALEQMYAVCDRLIDGIAGAPTRKPTPSRGSPAGSGIVARRL